MQYASSDLCDGASDLKAFILVAPAGVQALLVPRQLQLLWVQVYHGLFFHFDVRDQRLQDSGTEDDGGDEIRTEVETVLIQPVSTLQCEMNPGVVLRGTRKVFSSFPELWPQPKILALILR